MHVYCTYVIYIHAYIHIHAHTYICKYTCAIRHTHKYKYTYVHIIHTHTRNICSLGNKLVIHRHVFECVRVCYMYERVRLRDVCMYMYVHVYVCMTWYSFGKLAAILRLIASSRSCVCVCVCVLCTVQCAQCRSARDKLPRHALAHFALYSFGQAQDNECLFSSFPSSKLSWGIPHILLCLKTALEPPYAICAFLDTISWVIGFLISS